jgi:hypothetical protein
MKKVGVCVCAYEEFTKMHFRASAGADGVAAA